MMLLFGIITFVLGCVVGFGYGGGLAWKTIANDVKYFGGFRTNKAVYEAIKIKDIEPPIKNKDPQ